MARGISFLNSKVISDKEEFNAVIFSFIHGEPIEFLPKEKETPDAVVMISYRDSGIHYSYDLWIDGNIIIFKMTNGSNVTYRRFGNLKLKEIIKKLIEEDKKLLSD